MIDYTYVSLGLLVVFIISTIILYREIKKYYAEKRELARTNDMYIAHIHMLSDTGIVCAVVSTTSFIALILMSLLEQIGVL